MTVSYIKHNILLIDDNPSHAKALEEALIAAGDIPSNFEWARSLSSGLERLTRKKGLWAIFLNLFLPGSCSVDTIDKLQLLTPGVPIMVLGGADDEEICKAAITRSARLSSRRSPGRLIVCAGYTQLDCSRQLTKI